MTPRLQHNSTLAAAFHMERGITSLFPAASDQLPSIQINRRAIQKCGYNPSLIRFKGRTLLTYRFHPGSSWHTELAVADLDKDFNVTADRKVSANGSSIEDPRLFIHGGALWIAYVVSALTGGQPTSHVRYGPLVETATGWAIEGQFLLPYGKTEMEKNWVFFENGSELWVRYDWRTYLQIRDNAVMLTRETEALAWKWGIPRGGAGPVPFNGKLLWFFHSHLNNERPPIGWRYAVGAIVTETEAPFKAVAISKRPILRGSEADGLPEPERTACRHHKQNVVFPCGVVEGAGEWLVSVGANDCECLIVKIKEGDLQL